MISIEEIHQIRLKLKRKRQFRILKKILKEAAELSDKINKK